MREYCNVECQRTVVLFVFYAALDVLFVPVWRPCIGHSPAVLKLLSLKLPSLFVEQQRVQSTALTLLLSFSSGVATHACVGDSAIHTGSQTRQG